MKKMSLQALQSRAESVVSDELLTSISGGTENACHDDIEEVQTLSGKPKLNVES